MTAAKDVIAASCQAPGRRVSRGSERLCCHPGYRKHKQESVTEYIIIRIRLSYSRRDDKSRQLVSLRINITATCQNRDLGDTGPVLVTICTKAQY